jgi:hypothetical protein
MVTTDLIRVSTNFKKEIINYIKVKYYLANKPAPSDREITDKISKNQKIKEIIQNEFNP